MKTKRWKFSQVRPLLLWAGVLILIDQLSKIVVRAIMPVGVVLRPDLALSQSIRLVHLKNYGALGGFMESYSWLLSLITALICLALVYFYTRIPDGKRAARAAMILLLAGGLGNLIDRMVLGAVTDFISILSLPVMNIADLYVLAGLATLVLSIDEGEKQRASGPVQSSEEGGK